MSAIEVNPNLNQTWIPLYEHGPNDFRSTPAKQWKLLSPETPRSLLDGGILQPFSKWLAHIPKSVRQQESWSWEAVKFHPEIWDFAKFDFPTYTSLMRVSKRISACAQLLVPKGFNLREAYLLKHIPLRVIGYCGGERQLSRDEATQLVQNNVKMYTLLTGQAADLTFLEQQARIAPAHRQTWRIDSLVKPRIQTAAAQITTVAQRRHDYLLRQYDYQAGLTRLLSLPSLAYPHDRIELTERAAALRKSTSALDLDSWIVLENGVKNDSGPKHIEMGVTLLVMKRYGHAARFPFKDRAILPPCSGFVGIFSEENYKEEPIIMASDYVTRETLSEINHLNKSAAEPPNGLSAEERELLKWKQQLEVLEREQIRERAEQRLVDVGLKVDGISPEALDKVINHPEKEKVQYETKPTDFGTHCLEVFKWFWDALIDVCSCLGRLCWGIPQDIHKI